jgi:hypothetical protein
MSALCEHLEEASDCIKAMESRIERLCGLLRTRRRQGQDTAWAETLLEIMLSSRREAVVRRDLILLQMRLRLLGDTSAQCRKLADEAAYTNAAGARPAEQPRF